MLKKNYEKKKKAGSNIRSSTFWSYARDYAEWRDPCGSLLWTYMNYI